MTDPKPYIICTGQRGENVIFGWATARPHPGPEPVTLTDAKVIVAWRGKTGLLGLAARGPGVGSRITAAVSRLTDGNTVRTVIDVSPVAAAAITAWPPL